MVCVHVSIHVQVYCECTMITLCAYVQQGYAFRQEYINKECATPIWGGQYGIGKR